jgi:tight adherence protein C
MDIVLLTTLTFALAVAVVLSGYYAATAETPVERRLRGLAPQPATRQARSPSRPGFLKRGLAALGQYGPAGDETRLAATLSVAGIRSPNAPMLFLGTRTILSVGPAMLVLVPSVSQGRPLGQTLYLALVVWALGHFTMNHLLRRRARLRSRRISEALPDALDLMVVCLEAGLGLNSTIARVGEERSVMDDPLGQEFAQVAVELREGRSREEALRALGSRNGVEDLKALASLIIQCDRLGASMGDTLRAHADLLRTKRRQRIEEEARKLPIKMLFPLALFILPALFVVAVGPAVLRIREFFHAM